MVHFWASIARLVSRLGVVPAVAVVVGVGFAVSLHLKPQPALTPALRTVSIPNPTITYSHVLGYKIPDEVVLAYRNVFALQDEQRWKQADTALNAIGDDTLRGTALAQRYLHEGYESRYDELASWLRYYPDHPDAGRIASLAKRKKPVSATLPAVASAGKPLKGYGVSDGIHGQTMPARFTDGLNQWARGNHAKAALIFAEVANQKSLSGWNKAGAHYWAYRAHDAAGNSAQADTHLHQAAAHPLTLYGALALHAQGESVDAASRLPDVSTSMREVVAVKRAAYLAVMGRETAAEAELRALYPRLTDEGKAQLIRVAAELNLPGLQMRIAQEMVRGGNPAMAMAAYPTPGWIPGYDMNGDAALVFAIARQESGFNPQAVNPDSGATGLLQVMPNTARYVISHYKLNATVQAGAAPAFSVARLSEPVVNLVIGQHYMSYLGEKPYINGNLVHLLAAYNAGPGNLVEWQKKMAATNDPLLFIERIPFKETRHYVKQVLCNYLIYDAVLGGSSQHTAALADGQWPQVRPTTPRYDDVFAALEGATTRAAQ